MKQCPRLPDVSRDTAATKKTRGEHKRVGENCFHDDVPDVASMSTSTILSSVTISTKDLQVREQLGWHFLARDQV